MVADKLPLQSSNIANTRPQKTIEQTYQKKTQLEHILLRPDTYVGSIEKHTQALWVYENDVMVHRSVTYVPGLYKIFDEILVNAADNKQRDPSMDLLKVVIDPEQNCISVYNNGDGVPVEIHQEEGVYVPELIFGHLLTSSNYDDNVKKTTGGRNGYGAKLTNIFSTEFVIETADGKRQKKYKQVFSNNMGKKTEPAITKCKESENWTKITFKPDLAKFNMVHLEEDVVALMRKRVFDMAGCLGKTVKVELNGKRIPVKCFQDYVNLYLNAAAGSRPEPLPRIMEKVNDRWEIGLSLSDGQFQQVSFVNSIATIKGGTHVDYVTDQISKYVMNIVNKKNKHANVKAHNVKNHLWVFVNALIDNPAFDSQTKETLTLRQSSFGSDCKLSEDFLKKAAKSGVVDNLLSWANFKLSKDLKKTDGAKTGTLRGIPKLEDANDAGGRYSDQCTLILTEGDSAKALAMAGLSEVSRDKYGVFPLRGKLLNVREASHKQLMENAEIQHLKQILGLQQGKEYTSVKSLRYGHLMIMTDQDHDGSHIKGLLINFIHAFWPSLLKVQSFMVEFITPIVKATNKRNGNVLSFYSMPEYESWKESLGGNASGWVIKYYKGLGTSTSKEGKEYFRNLNMHRKEFQWQTEDDGDAIELAFSKKKIEARKNWLRQFEPGTHLDQKQRLIKYSDFINKELILFSMADLQRSIPSMVDGLKPGQRKILFCAFKRNLVKEAKVAQFSGYVSEHSAYHHGEQSLASTIVGMAQDFVGSNNINLLQPNGQFGTRNQGGKDAASARYIFTRLSPITRHLFPKDDDGLLNYLNEDGQSIEPSWYMPVIPTVLVNGSEGIGTGWSTYVPNYNPRDIIMNVRRLLNGEEMEPMHPWYRGFKGTIEKTASKEAGVTYTITGIVEEVNETTLRVTELPVRRWTNEYKEFLEALSAKEQMDPLIKDFKAHSDDTNVDFEITVTEEKMNMIKQDILKKLKLTTTISTSNMHLFDANGVIKKYDTPEQILDDFFSLRLEFYEKRKRVLLENLEKELLKLDNKVRFILAVVHGEIIVNNRKRAELFIELHEKGFTPLPKNKVVDVAVAGATDDNDETEDNSELAGSKGVRGSDYDYLLSLAIGTLTLEKVQELCSDRDKMNQEVEDLRKTTPKSLWLRDLDSVEEQLDGEDKKDAEADEQYKLKSKMKREDGSKAAPKKAAKAPRKYTKKVSDKTIAAEPSGPAPMESENAAAAEVTKPKGGRGGGQKKAPAKKVNDVEDDDDDEGVGSLRERLAKYNLNSSPEQSISSMETEEPAAKKKEAEAKRGGGGGRKKSSTTTTVISEDEDEIEVVETTDDDFDASETRKKKGAAAKGKPPAAAAARKRGPAKKQTAPAASQKLLTEMLKPVVESPEKKVRKMRASPFNKKSGSVLGRVASVENSGSSSSSSVLQDIEEAAEEPAAKARPQRANRKQMTYVVSDSSEEEEENDEEDATEDSDFDAAED